MRFTPALFQFSLLISLLLATCDVDENPSIRDRDFLPPATTHGTGTFGCRINGEVWRNAPTIFNDNIDLDYSSHWEIFNLGVEGASKYDDPGNFEAISVSANFSTSGTHSIRAATYANESRDLPCDMVILNEHLTLDDLNFLKITRLDATGGVISGEFAFVVIDSLCLDTIRVTDGRFDYGF
jgi:hypothetical protein